MKLGNDCQGCGRERPADAPAGLCPICLLRAGHHGGASVLDHDYDEPLVSLDSETPGNRSGQAYRSDNPTPDRAESLSHDGAGVPRRSSRIELHGPLGRGGMGIVLKGRDGDLGRDLAVKVLLEKYRDQPEMVRRFIEEAQIGGQLQHPGVVPVYELGILPDHRPYFAMKLIRGRTLTELLRGRSRVDDDLPRLLAIFEAVCQTMAYAHTRGVIHRDLKPSNIMVGSFGEVQVMDWGIAKVLGQIPEPFGEKVSIPEVQDPYVWTGRSDSDIDRSNPGSVIGTPAYMAPEQARGEIHAVDERADVFALGAILCEILTGRPAFVGETSAEIARIAAHGDLTDAYDRLARSAADTELAALARESLAPVAGDRPRDARAVAMRITAYRAGVQEKLRTAELMAAEAHARAEEETKRRGLADQLAREALVRATLERRRRRLSVALAGAILTLVIVCGSAATWLVQERQARLNKVELAFRESEVLADLARRDPGGNVSQWESARAAVRRARELMEAVPFKATQARYDDLAARIDQGAAAALVDQTLVTRLEEIRAGMDRDAKSDADYQRAFREAGFDLVSPGLDPAAAGKRLGERPKGVARAVASALDAWALVRRSLTSAGDASGWAVFQNLLAVARAADPDPWRVTLHEALSKNDVAPLVRLAQEPAIERHGPTRLWFLGFGLEVLGDRDRALDVLKKAQQAHPGDYWVNTELGLVLINAKRSGPGATSSFISVNTGTAASRFHEAESVFMAAVAVRPHFAPAHHLLGTACHLQGKYDQAIACYERALAISPNDATIHNSLANVLLSQGRDKDAIAQYRRAISLSLTYDLAHANLMWALANQGKIREAITATRNAMELAPEFTMAHVYLGDYLSRLGQPETAIGEYQIAARLLPTVGQIVDHLGSAYLQQGKLDSAIAAYREAIRLSPEFADGRQHLAYALLRQGKCDAAISEYQEAVRISPQYAAAHANLGIALRQRGDFDRAVLTFRSALELASDASLRQTLHLELARTERWQALADQHPAMIHGDQVPPAAAEKLDLAYFLHERQQYPRAARLFRDALDQDPEQSGDANTQNRYNAACSFVLASEWAKSGDRDGDRSRLTDAERIELRQRARDNLRTDLIHWSRVLSEGVPAKSTQVQQTLRHWKIDLDLASVREPEALAKLSEGERKEWLALWTQVNELVDQSNK